MKIVRLFTLLLSLFIFGCSDDNGESRENDNAEYYVKYEATVSSRYPSDGIFYTVATENGTEIFTNKKSLNVTFGPLKKGFTAELSIDASSLYIADCTANIYVCRGCEPFSLKATGTGSKGVWITYTIVY